MRLAEHSWQTPPAFSDPGSDSVDVNTSPESYQDRQAIDGDTVTAADDTLQPRQSTEQTPPAFSDPGSDSVDVNTSPESYQDRQAIDGDTVTAADDTLQPRQSTEKAVANDAHSRQIALAEQILASTESFRTIAPARLAAVDPKIRLVLRKHPVVPAVIISDVVTRLIAVALIISFRRLGYSSAVSQEMDARDRVLASTLARVLDLDLFGAFDRTRDQAFTLDSALALALDLDSALGRANVLASTLARVPALDSDPDLNVDHVLHVDRVLDSALDRILDSALGCARVLAHLLSRVLTRDFDLVGASNLDLDLDRALALGLARVLARDLDNVLDLDLARDFARSLDLARELAGALAREFGPQNMEGLASAFLAGGLDDFSRADLSRVDLTGVDLVGVRWSEWGTRWPPETDIEGLRSVSKETEPGSGVFVITRPGGTDRTREAVRV